MVTALLQCGVSPLGGQLRAPSCLSPLAAEQTQSDHPHLQAPFTEAPAPPIPVPDAQMVGSLHRLVCILFEPLSVAASATSCAVVNPAICLAGDFFFFLIMFRIFFFQMPAFVGRNVDGAAQLVAPRHPARTAGLQTLCSASDQAGKVHEGEEGEILSDPRLDNQRP